MKHEYYFKNLTGEIKKIALETPWRMPGAWCLKVVPN
jgi:hypothetical protein